ncbi:MAG: hypothetical protein J6V41_04550 [Kiritimatiellae bacterium]|nr:hypothetical protein [Kiritimatiellia bacterium]
MNTTCPHCNTTLEIDGVEPGTTIQCPACSKSFAVQENAAPKVKIAVAQAQDFGGKYCRSCGAKILSNAAVCLSCGCNVNQGFYSYCETCGTKRVNPNAVVCMNCGSKFQSSMGSSNFSEWLTPFLLCLFFGYYGGHLFYTKDTKLAVIRLLISIFSVITYIVTEACAEDYDLEILCNISIVLFLASFLAAGIWNLVDLIRLACGSYKTSDGRLISYK